LLLAFVLVKENMPMPRPVLRVPGGRGHGGRMPKSPRKAVEMGALEGLIGFHLRVAQIQVFRDFERGLAELGVTPASFSVLEVLSANPGLTQSRLAHAVHLDRSSVVPLLDKLEDRGFIRRRASTTDRRNNHIDLTATGQNLLAEAMARVLEHEQRIAGRLSAGEKKELIALLGRIGGVA
jgi:DNA-binding MarR family transcriptional regulator